MCKNTIEAGFFEPAFSYITPIVYEIYLCYYINRRKKRRNFILRYRAYKKKDLGREYGFRPVIGKRLEKAAFVVLIFTHIFDRIHLYIKEVWANGRYDKKNK